jgi:ATP-dependent Clp protease, protease subunit
MSTNTATIRFTAEVNKKSVQKLLGYVDEQLKHADKIRLLLSSEGGSIQDGLMVYHYLKKAPLEIETVNMGSVDSITVVMYCAGKVRMSVPQASFLIHSTAFSPDEKEYQEKKLKEQVRGLEEERKIIAEIIAETCNKRQKEVEEMMMEGITLSATKAKEFGLVTDISDDVLQNERDVIAVT